MSMLCIKVCVNNVPYNSQLLCMCGHTESSVLPLFTIVQMENKLRAVPEIILRGWGVGRKHFFVLWGGGCFVDSVSEGWGWVGSNLSWGSRHI